MVVLSHCFLVNIKHYSNTRTPGLSQSCKWLTLFKMNSASVGISSGKSYALFQSRCSHARKRLLILLVALIERGGLTIRRKPCNLFLITLFDAITYGWFADPFFFCNAAITSTFVRFGLDPLSSIFSTENAISDVVNITATPKATAVLWKFSPVQEQVTQRQRRMLWVIQGISYVCNLIFSFL